VEKAKSQSYETLLLVIGNDFLNFDGLVGETTAGTPQDNSVIWYDLVDEAIALITYVVNQLLTVSNVQIVNVASNHDQQTMFIINRVISAYYKDNQNVTMPDESPRPRKYIKFHRNIVGLTHNIPLKQALNLMTTEGKEWWTECNHFFYIAGHLHNQMTYESQGILEILRVPAVCPASRWSSEKGMIATHRGIQSFVIDADMGIVETWNFYI
jgi:hypothetical protein